MAIGDTIREDAKTWYVTNLENVTLKDVAKEFNIPVSSIYIWSKEGLWKESRKNFLEEYHSESKKELIEESAKKFAGIISDLAFEHFASYRSTRVLAEKFFNNSLLESQNLGFSVVDVNKAESWSRILDRAVKGERQAAGLEYEDLSKAIQEIERSGLTVVTQAEAERLRN